MNFARGVVDAAEPGALALVEVGAVREDGAGFLSFGGRNDDVIIFAGHRIAARPDRAYSSLAIARAATSTGSNAPLTGGA